MGKKIKGGRRQILQLEEKKSPKGSNKSKVKNLIHYSDSDDDSKKSNDSDSGTTETENKSTPLDSQVADFFKEINALVVPEEPEENSKPLEKLQTKDSVQPSESATPVVVEETHEKNLNVWHEICDESTGYNYYWNVETNEVTWERPVGIISQPESLNSTATHVADEMIQLEKQHSAVDNRKKETKKEVSLPEGAIIPISYYGESSSESSESEDESSKLNISQASKKRASVKRQKSSKKDSSASKSKCEIGPQLPPNFQFPSPLALGNEVKQKTVTNDDVSKCVATPQSLSNENLPAKEDTLSESLSKGADAESVVLQKENAGGSSDVKSSKLSSSVSYGLKSVVAYDSFTDEEEEPVPSDPLPAKAPSVDVMVPVPEPAKKESEDLHKEPHATKNNESPVSEVAETPITAKETPTQEVSHANVEKLQEPQTLKRKMDASLSESLQKEELVKKPKRTEEVDIDSMFAHHSSYGKFGFGWQRDLNEENDSHSLPKQAFRPGKRSQKGISFVKSDNVLDLKELYEDAPLEVIAPDAALEEPNKDDQSSTETKEETIIEIQPDLCNVENQKENTSDVDTHQDDKEINSEDGENEKAIENEAEDIKTETCVDSPPSKKESPEPDWDMEDDIDDIDQALSEALEKAKKKKALLDRKCAYENYSELTKSHKEDRSVKDTLPDREVEFLEDIHENYSDFVDKLNLLLTNQSPPSPVSSYLIQLQTRYYDWKAGALNTQYFVEKLKEADSCIQHFEMNLVSAPWQCKWDSFHFLVITSLVFDKH